MGNDNKKTERNYASGFFIIANAKDYFSSKYFPDKLLGAIASTPENQILLSSYICVRLFFYAGGPFLAIGVRREHFLNHRRFRSFRNSH